MRLKPGYLLIAAVGVLWWLNQAKTPSVHKPLVREHNATHLPTTQKKQVMTEENGTTAPSVSQPLPHDVNATAAVCSSPLRLYDDADVSLTCCFKQQKFFLPHNDATVTAVHIVKSDTAFTTGMLPYLNDMAMQYPDDLRIVVVDIASKPINKGNVRWLFFAQKGDKASFVKQLARTAGLHTNLPVPLTVLFINGKAVATYEGLVPVEMLRHDLMRYLKPEE